MPKLGGVAILMHKLSDSLKHVKWIVGDTDTAVSMQTHPSFPPFSDSACTLLDTWATYIRKDVRSRAYGEVVSFAFWCRKSSLLSLRKPYETMERRLGRGCVFHIAPSNVPINFAYSLAVGILAGNVNIVRVPSKEFEQVDIIANALEKALSDPKNAFMKRVALLCRYDHNKDVTNAFSQICDMRVIWGGDNTIKAIRCSPLRTRTTEIYFADRYSFAIIDADAYLKSETYEQIAMDFYNDTYLTDQNACTSPRLVVWLGKKIKKAQEVFWTTLHQRVIQEYKYQPVQAIQKLHLLYKRAFSVDGLQLKLSPDTLIYCVQVPELNTQTLDECGHSGFFFEYTAASLDEMLPLCSEKCQTIAYYGIPSKKIWEVIERERPRGVDRIVPIGKTLDFSLVWDGYDLIRSMSRAIVTI